MDISRFEKISDTEWRIAPFGAMRAPGIIYATESLLVEMDDKVFEQVTNVAMLPGIVRASYAMPDAHWGYGFPIGGVAAFDPKGGYDGMSGPPPAGSSLGMYSKDTGTPAPVNLEAGKTAHIDLAFDDTAKMQ